MFTNKLKTVSESECEVSKMGHLPPRARGRKVRIVQNISSEKNYSSANQRCGCVSDVRLESVMIILARGEVVLSFA